MNVYLRTVPYCLLLVWLLSASLQEADNPPEQVLPLEPVLQPVVDVAHVEDSHYNNTGEWEGVKQGEWLHGPCPVKAVSMPDSVIQRTGTIEVYPWNSSDMEAVKGKLMGLHGNVTKTDACWGSDLMMVCSSCCDGLMKSCAGHFDVRKWGRKFRHQVTNPWKAAIYKGQFYSINNSYVPRSGLRLSGLPAHDDRDAITTLNCTETRTTPLLIMKNGDWTRGTSMNVAHWLGEIMGVILGALHQHNVKRMQLLVPNCPTMRPGPTKQCKTFPIANDNFKDPHLRASPFHDGTNWTFSLANKLGVPWIKDTTTHIDIDSEKVICYDKVVWGCPTPRACPTPKYLATIMPLYQHFLKSRYGMVYDVPLKGTHMVLLTRKPNGTRYITNSEDMLKTATGLGWEAEGLPVWKSEEVGYSKMVSALQGSNVVASMHGADLAFAQVFMRKHTVAIEMLLEHAAREDPFYVFQAHGAAITTVRWSVAASSIPEWSAQEIEHQFNGTHKYKNNISWRRQNIPFTLPLHSWKVVLQTAELLL